MATLEELVVRIRADASQLEREMKRAGQVTEQAGKKIGSSMESARRSALAFATALASGAMLAYAKTAIDAAGRMNDLAGQIGFTSTTLASLETGLIASGATLDDLTSSVNLMNNAIGEAAKGGQEQIEAFDALGLSVRKLQQLTPEEQFFEIAQALGRVGEQYRQTEIGRSIFGRGFSTLLPLLKESKGDLRGLVEQTQALGEGLSSETIQRVDDFGDSLSKVGLQIRNEFLTEFAKIAPAVQSLTEDLVSIPSYLRAAFIDIPSVAGQGIGNYLAGRGLTSNAKTERQDLSAFQLQINKQLESQGLATPSGGVASGGNKGLIKVKQGEKQKEAQNYDEATDALSQYISQQEQELELTGLTGKALAMKRAQQEAHNAVIKEGNLLTPEMTEQVRANAAAIYEATEAATKLNDAQQEAIRFQAELKDKFSDTLSTIILDFDNAADAAKRFAEAIAQMIIEKRITGPLADALGGAIDSSGIGGSIGDFFGGFFADGGRPPMGRVSVVGENGPELFVPDSRGTIIPNNQIGGGGMTFHQTINISPGIQGTVRSELMQAIPGIVKASKDAVIAATQKGGSDARLLGRRG